MKNWLLKRLKVWCWGVAKELDLPPEFVITKHAMDRIDQRIFASNGLTHEQWTVLAWEEGKKLSVERTARYKDRFRKNFHSMVYKEFAGLIYVFGLYFRRDLEPAQKWLITVIPYD